MNWWRFQGDAEPSGFALTMHRLNGVVLVAVSVSLTLQLT